MTLIAYTIKTFLKKQKKTQPFSVALFLLLTKGGND